MIVSGPFPPGVFLVLGILQNFGSENQTREVVAIHKNFELSQVFMDNYLF